MIRTGRYDHLEGEIPGPNNDDVVVVLQVRQGKSRRAAQLMRTVGADLSASERHTALAAIEWEEGRARVGEPSLGLADAALLERLAAAEWVAIDAPFGWPEPMVAATHAYATAGRWPAVGKQDFRYWLTDRFVHDHVLAETEQALWPLSPSTERVGELLARPLRLSCRTTGALLPLILDLKLRVRLHRMEAAASYSPLDFALVDADRVEGRIHELAERLANAAKQRNLRLANAAKQRNLIVHLYLEIDDRAVFAALAHLDDLREFAASLERLAHSDDDSTADQDA